MVHIIIYFGLSNELAKTNDSCNNSCNENATCVDGECQCKPGYVGNGKVCLPGGLFTEIKPTVVLTTNEGTYLIFNNRLIITDGWWNIRTLMNWLSK